MIKLMTTVGLIAGLALAGCGGSQKGSGSGDCQAAATNMGTIMRSMMASMGGEDEADKMVPALQSIVGERCSADKWSKAATDCIIKATDTKGLDVCEEMITPAQRDSLKNAMNAEMDAQGGKGDATSAPPPTGGEEGGTGGGGGDPCGDGADPCGGGE